jgi:hypothetical protein
MKRSTLVRDIIGTAVMFFVLVLLAFVLLMCEKYLDAFKAH